MNDNTKKQQHKRERETNEQMHSIHYCFRLYCSSNPCFRPTFMYFVDLAFVLSLSLSRLFFRYIHFYYILIFLLRIAFLDFLWILSIFTESSRSISCHLVTVLGCFYCVNIQIVIVKMCYAAGSNS